MKWRGEIAIKHQAAQDSCALSQRSKNPIEKQRLIEECTRLKTEVTTQTTEVNIETSKVEDTDKTNAE